MLNQKPVFNQKPVLLVITNMPNQAEAEALAESLVTKKLAVCVNILAPCLSVYEWHDASGQNQLERSSEIPLLIKTNPTQYPALEAAILEAHPYELPEIISINVDGGLPRYLQWVDTQLSA